MSLSGNKSGSLQNLVNSGGITGNASLALNGSSNPTFGVSAPAGLTGANSKITTAATCVLAVDDPGGLITTSSVLAVFWTTSAGTILNACFDCAVTSATVTSGINAVTLTQSGGTAQPTSARYWASSGSAPTSLPAATTAITVAIAQDITDGVSIPAGSGTFNIQQLIATSTQPGLVEWLTNSSGSQERLSALLSAGAFDTWPTAAAQVGTLPTGGAVNSGNATGAWVTNTTVTDLRCYNLGSTLAGIGVSSQSANMQAGAILA